MADKEVKSTEVRETNQQVGDTNVSRQTVSQSETVPSSVIAQRIVYYVGGAIVLLLVIRMVLLLLAANQGSGFVDFIYGLSGVFAAPFFGIFSYEPAYGSSVLEVSTIVAILIYGILTIGIAKLFTLNKREQV